MFRHRSARIGIRAAAALFAAAMLAGTTAQVAGAQTIDAEQAASPISHLVLHPGTDETQRNHNWFTTTAAEGAEWVQFAPASAATGEEFPVAEATAFAAELTGGNDLGLTTATATVTGLAASTEYVYRVGSNEGGWSATFRTTTGGFDGGFEFLYYADPQLGAASSSQLGEGISLAEEAQGWYSTLEVSTSTYPDSSFLLSGGDQIDGYDDTGKVAAFLPGDRDEQYEALLADDTLREYPLAVVSGNHDDADWTYDEYWNMPNDESHNYRCTHNGTLFIGLDTNMVTIYDYLGLYQATAAVQRATTDEVRAAAQENLREVCGGIMRKMNEGFAGTKAYFEGVIAECGADADWIVVVFHQSLYSQATHYTDPDVSFLRDNFSQTLSDAGVDLVLGGHDHIYTRTHLMSGTAPVVPEAAPAIGDVLVPEEGEVLYLTGTSASGGKFYPFTDRDGGTDPAKPHASTAMWDQQDRAGYMNVRVEADSLTVTVHNTDDNSVLDEVTLQRGAPVVDEPVDEEPEALDCSQVRAGDTVEVSLSGFAAEAEVRVELHSMPVELATVTTDADGAATASVTVPAGTEPGAHSVVATDTATVDTASAPLEVLVADVPAQTDEPATDEPGTDAPATDAPVTDAPATEPPAEEPAATADATATPVAAADEGGEKLAATGADGVAGIAALTAALVAAGAGLLALNRMRRKRA